MNQSPRFSLFLLFLLLTPMEISGQSPQFEQWFWPFHTLPRNASVSPSNKEIAPSSLFNRFDRESEALLFLGKKPTHRISRRVPTHTLPKKEISLAIWVKDHVNSPIGSLIAAKDVHQLVNPAWVLGYYGHKAYVSLRTYSSDSGLFTDSTDWEITGWRPYKRYFSHLVLTYDGDTLRCYINGELKEKKAQTGAIAYPSSYESEAAAYLKEEPHMRLGDHLLYTSLWDRALTQPEVLHHYQQLQQQVDSGAYYPDTFHLIAGPYLHHVTQEDISLTWEANYPSTAVLRYGTDAQLSNQIEFSQAKTIHTVSLKGLTPETRYYYRLTVKKKLGEASPSRGNNESNAETVDTGLLSFATARSDTSAYSFTVFGDTEARPHINALMGERVWEERPDFMINLGDLTDGGRERHKFEWNYEYFLGMTPLNSRIPVFPVPGNGEGDLYWYKRYHKLPNGEAYYSFRYGNAEFFMLNSNNKEELEPGGIQYRWLEEQLKQSRATWKFACHHHPVYTSDENDYGNTWEGEASALGDLQVRELVQLYESYGVDMVFYGHLHTYERTWPLLGQHPSLDKGVVYLVAGGAGGNLEDFAPTRSWFSTKLYRGHHYCKLDVFQHKLYFKMYDLNGALKDYFELSK